MGKKLNKLAKSFRNRLPSKERVIRTAIGIAIISVAVFLVAKLYKHAEARASQPHVLVLYSANSEGGLVQLESLYVQRPWHKPDGSICFVAMQDGSNGCLKAPYYLLKEANVE